MSETSPSSPQSAPQQPSGGKKPGANTTTVVRRRTERKRPPLIFNLTGFVIEVVIVSAILALLNWPALRDSLFVVVIQRGTATTTQPLLARGFLATVLPWLDGAIVFAFLVRVLARFAGTTGLTLLLGLLARLAGAAAISYMLLQPVIFSTPSGAPAPFGSGTLQGFAEFWGRAVLIVVLVFTCLGVLVQLWELVRHRRS